MAEITQVSGSGAEDPDRGGTETEQRSRTQKSTRVDFLLRGARNCPGRPEQPGAPGTVRGARNVKFDQNASFAFWTLGDKVLSPQGARNPSRRPDQGYKYSLGPEAFHQLSN